MDPSPGRSMRISLVQNRDCANFVVSCLNHIPPLINAFILNSPSTLNCPITALTLTDQTDSVSKANPSQIQTQARSKLKVGMFILPSSRFFSMTPMPMAAGLPAEQWIPVHTQFCGSGTPDIPPASPASHSGTQTLGQGCHPHSPSVPSSPGAMPRTPVHRGQWKFSFCLERVS